MTTDERDDNLDMAVHVYLDAHDYCVNEIGWGNQIDWQRERDLDKITAEMFVSEACWVVLNSGMAYRVCVRKWEVISKIFGDFEHLDEIVQNENDLREQTLCVFKSQRKINAILEIAKRVQRENWEDFREKIRAGGIEFLQELPMIGPATAYHLAKNIGFPVAKPDRHLVRLASMFGYGDVQEFCEQISIRTGDTVPVIDLVLWRYAIDDPGYVKILERMGK